MIINCDVCDMPLLQSGNEGIYSCKEVPVWIEDGQRYLEVRHTTCHINQDKITYKVISIFPYEFQLLYDVNKTIISKVVIKNITHNKNSTPVKHKKVLLEIDQIIDLPWNDREQVIQKLKLYSVFS